MDADASPRRRGETVAVVITPDAVRGVDAGEASARVDAAECAFHEAAHVRAAWHGDRVRDAFAVIEAMRYRPTGAVVAAATTSVPEAPGADRQFDYRFGWLRDGSLAASVAAMYDRVDLARATWASSSGSATTCSARQCSRSTARPCPQSGPSTTSRVGEDRGRSAWGTRRRSKSSSTRLGFVVEAVSTYTRDGGRLHRRLWSLVRAVAERCCDPEPAASNGIWEYRDAKRFVSADIGRWIALDRAAHCAAPSPVDAAQTLVSSAATPRGRACSVNSAPTACDRR